MDLCIKTSATEIGEHNGPGVSILVLMDLCIKTPEEESYETLSGRCFNPCFNGSMYKNKDGRWIQEVGGEVSILVLMDLCIKTIWRCALNHNGKSFNPCFNGSMYKNIDALSWRC